MCIRDRLRPGPAEPACIVMVESRAALDARDDLVRVPGLHGIYVGPFDLGLSLPGTPGDADEPVLSAAIDTVLAAAEAADLPAGVHRRPVPSPPDPGAAGAA